MKTKKLVLAIAAVLGATTLAACTDNNQKILFNDYWQKNWVTEETVDETLTYDVKFEKGGGVDTVNYDFSYGTGSYITHLQSNAQGYEYTTTLTLPVSYQFNGATETFTDIVTTKVTFRRSDEGLEPIASEKKIDSHTPLNLKAKKIEDCYAHYKYAVTTAYENGAGKSTVEYDKTKDIEKRQVPSKFNYNSGKYSYLDNEQAILALRAIPNDISSGSFNVYNPAEKKMERAKFSFSAATGIEFHHTVNGAPLTQKNINYRPVTLSLDAKDAGPSQTAWIATTAEDTTKNVNRNVLLRLEDPLAYSFGKLIYTLVSAENL